MKRSFILVLILTLFSLSFSIDLKLPEEKSLEGTVTEIHIFERIPYIVVKTDDFEIPVLSHGIFKIIALKIDSKNWKLRKTETLTKIKKIFKNERIFFKGYFVSINDAFKIFVPTKMKIKDKEIDIPIFRAFKTPTNKFYKPMPSMYRNYPYPPCPYYNQWYFWHKRHLFPHPEFENEPRAPFPPPPRR